MVLAFAQTIVVFSVQPGCACSVRASSPETIVTSERLTSRSLDGQLIRLAVRFFGLVSALAHHDAGR